MNFDPTKAELSLKSADIFHPVVIGDVDRLDMTGAAIGSNVIDAGRHPRDELLETVYLVFGLLLASRRCGSRLI
jgi:hypothetical protein